MKRTLISLSLAATLLAQTHAQQLAGVSPAASHHADELHMTSVLPAKESVVITPGVVRATQNLRPGMVLSAADLVVESGAPSSLDIYVGQEIKRAVYAGKTLSPNDVGPPTAVERNAIVMLEFIRGPLMITTEGRALDSGAVGDRVRIMNLSSKIILTGTVTGHNKAVTR